MFNRFPERERLTWGERFSEIGRRLLLLANYANPEIPTPEMHKEMEQERKVQDAMRDIAHQIADFFEENK